MDARTVEHALMKFSADFEGEEYDEDWGNGSWFTFDYEVTEGELPDGLGKFKVIERVGGEGEGDHMHLVFQVDDPEGDLVGYYRINGWYSSFGGSEYDGDLYEVQKTERLVTFYE